MNSVTVSSSASTAAVEDRVRELLDRMTLTEKVGQMSQVNVGDGPVQDFLVDDIRAGRIGSVLNTVDANVVNELQRLALEESRLGIPLLVGRDVIHGFRTVMPIPLGQAATWNPDIVQDAARVAAQEAAACGVNWTFAPMIDVARDPRWGRIAESLGEDPLLTAVLGAAMVRGFQGDTPGGQQSVAACGKHFAGYGAAESGRDYAATNIPENELRNVHLRPFKAAIDAGLCSVMTSFSDVDGVPATANSFLLRTVLREEWGFRGIAVSDWDSVKQLNVHGLTASDRDAAFEAASAGLDMEMHGDAFRHHLEDLVEQGILSPTQIDSAVANILRIKFSLGLFDRPLTTAKPEDPTTSEEALAIARESALQSIVMLKNEHRVLPLSPESTRSIALIGPLANAARDQLGTWIFDGDPALSVTPVQAIQSLLGPAATIHHVPALETTRSRQITGLDEALFAARQADVVVAFVGEEAILSGEAHSRADIHLPGAQPDLLRQLKACGKPVVAVVMAGRPLVLTDVVDDVDAILFAAHPGTMGGPAIADLLFGIESPSGKLPATFPRMVGQVPIYYAQKNTGRPPTPSSIVLIDDIDADADQLSTGMTAYHLDAGFTPLFPFGFGLSYADFEYTNLRLSAAEMRTDESLDISVDLTNTGDCVATEVVQLYVRDLVGSVTRPVRELKAFRRVRLAPGERNRVTFCLHADDLAFFDRNNRLAVEAGEFHVWVGGSSAAELKGAFVLRESEPA